MLRGLIGRTSLRRIQTSLESGLSILTKIARLKWSIRIFCNAQGALRQSFAEIVFEPADIAANIANALSSALHGRFPPATQ